ncbi:MULTISPECIES: hypothetical protein [unclassified Halomonas]|uniref:hypothetical protein n=1 Tax=unclassified Halomonas TaxID=2609666 RepID=UPI0020769B6E|nr:MULTISPECIES: hypothetical protein [unclassified Halomonas]
MADFDTRQIDIDGLIATANAALPAASAAPVATSGAYSDLSGLPVFGNAAFTEATDYATQAQGEIAETAVQPGELATVATSGQYDDLVGTPSLGTAAAADTGDFATAEQGQKADTAAQAVGFTTIAVVTEYPAEEDPNTLYVLVSA